MKAIKSSLDENILALSWNIATEPKLFRKLAPNPYSAKALQIISERFPNINYSDVIKAIILAEPGGRLPESVEKNEEIDKRLTLYLKKNTRKLRFQSKEYIYNILIKSTFKTDELGEIEKNYTQDQRRDFKLLIINYIENPHKSKWKVLGATLLILFVFFVSSLNKKQIPSVIGIQNEKQGLPLRLIIPSIEINTKVQHLGINEKGEMDVPDNTADVGWFSLGPKPGEIGSAVIDGHFNGKNGASGVFSNLYKLKTGDKLFIEDDVGVIKTFVVREIRTYNPGYEKEVFDLSDNAHLNLITCDGVWDGTKKSFTKRLVVFADISQ